MSSVTSEYLAAVKWAEESYSPVDFITNIKLPQVGKVIKGQIQGQQIGVPTSATPTLNQTIFWLKVAKKTRVIAQCVKFKEVRGSPVQRAVVTGPRLEISDDYQGWFEILSEDGRCARSIESVVELVKRFPRRVLVREAIKVFTGKKNTTGDFLSEKTRVIQVGEVLQLDSLASFTCKSANDKYLKCLTSSGEGCFLLLACFFFAAPHLSLHHPCVDVAVVLLLLLTSSSPSSSPSPLLILLYLFFLPPIQRGFE